MCPSLAVEKESTRRDFLHRILCVGFGLAVLQVLVGIWCWIRPNRISAKQRPIVLGMLSDFREGTLTWLKKQELFVQREEGGIAAFSSRCTHLGCTLKRVADGFHCPCHGAQFDLKGYVKKGPAQQALSWYTVRIDKKGKLRCLPEQRLPNGEFSPLRMMGDRR